MKGRIIGSNVKSWVQFMMPILSNYKQYWSYTKTILSNTGLGQILATVDIKFTIKKKTAEHNLEYVEQDDEFYHVLYHLYPEVFLL